jgi:hypothetical protein
VVSLSIKDNPFYNRNQEGNYHWNGRLDEKFKARIIYFIPALPPYKEKIQGIFKFFQPHPSPSPDSSREGKSL